MDSFDAWQESERGRWEGVALQRENLYEQIAALRMKYGSTSSKAKKSAFWSEIQQCKTALNALDSLS